MGMGKKDIGRNDPCWCGSGKKYKKCHLRKDEEEHREERDAREREHERARVERLASRHPELEASLHALDAPSFIEAALHMGGEEFMAGRAYKIAHEVERARQSFFSPAEIIALLTTLPYTISTVRAWSTDELLEKLAGVGVELTRERFLEEARDFTSAWKLGMTWIDPARDFIAREPDLIGLAACELWRRWLPERPSVEMLYDRLHSYDPVLTSASDHEDWTSLWRIIDALLPEEIDTIDAAERHLDFPLGLEKWVMSATIDLHDHTPDELAPEAAEIASRMLARFSGEHQGLQNWIRGELALLLVTMDRMHEAEELFTQMIDLAPDSAQGHVMWAGVLHRRGGLASCRAAIALLERALASEAEDLDYWEVDLFLAELRDHTQELEERED